MKEIRFRGMDLEKRKKDRKGFHERGGREKKKRERGVRGRHYNYPQQQFFFL